MGYSHKMAALPKLYVKGGPGNKDLGDCPFSHRATLAFRIKGVRPELVLVDLSNKPAWFLELTPAGSVPVLRTTDGRIITNSAEIVEHVDETYRDPSLKPEGWKAALDGTDNIFNEFSKYAKHFKGAANKEELEKAFTEELKKIDALLAKGPGPLLCGAAWSVPDCYLLPRLYHIRAVAQHYMKYTAFSDMPALLRYMEHGFSSAEFKDTSYPEDYILQGWAKYF